LPDPKLNIGLILYPKLTLLDLIGPAEVFGQMPGTDVHLLWKSLDPVIADGGITLFPTSTFAACPRLDVICVPGGPGQIELMDDEVVLDFLRHSAKDCRLITSVCSGSLLLAAAGLLQGYRATCHWASLDQLALLGTVPVAERVVRDRDRITGAGVTSGIDFALTVVGELLGREVAEEIQLGLEYDPEPPFAAGSPKKAPAKILAAVREDMAGFLARRRQATQRAAERLKRGG
jgi:cyclohexyl-isocyanide hydratase